MSDINLQEVKKLVRTKKDKSDFESLKLFLEARDSGDFSKWQNFILKRANRNNRKDLKKITLLNIISPGCVEYFYFHFG